MKSIEKRISEYVDEERRISWIAADQGCVLSQKAIILCNAGKERSRMLAASLDSILSEISTRWDVVARGTYGLGSDDKGVQTKYGWVPPEGFVKLLEQEELKFPTYQSKMISEEEAKEADIIIAIDPVIGERVKKAYPAHAGKVVVALEVISRSQSPFPRYLGHSIPDAWGGHLSEKVVTAIEDSKSIDDRVKNVESALGTSLDDAARQYVVSYDPKKSDPTDIKSIPKELRDYLGHPLDSDQAYLHEAKMLKKVAVGLCERGYFR